MPTTEDASSFERVNNAYQYIATRGDAPSFDEGNNTSATTTGGAPSFKKGNTFAMTTWSESSFERGNNASI